MTTTAPTPSAGSPGTHQSRQTRSPLGLTFSERHPAVAWTLTLLGLVVLGVTTGGALGRLAVQLLGFALAQVGAER